METTHFIGHDDEGTRYYAEIRLEQSGKTVEFTDHTTGTLEYEFAVCGFAIEKNRRQASSAGQMCDDFLKITKPAEGWQLSDIAELVELWREWHLNEMQAWSDEQRVAAVLAKFDYDKLRYLVDSTGYKYGSKWLARQLPPGHVDRIKHFMSLPSGRVPVSY